MRAAEGAFTIIVSSSEIGVVQIASKRDSVQWHTVISLWLSPERCVTLKSIISQFTPVPAFMCIFISLDVKGVTRFL